MAGFDSIMLGLGTVQFHSAKPGAEARLNGVFWKCKKGMSERSQPVEHGGLVGLGLVGWVGWLGWLDWLGWLVSLVRLVRLVGLVGWPGAVWNPTATHSFCAAL